MKKKLILMGIIATIMFVFPPPAWPFPP